MSVLLIYLLGKDLHSMPNKTKGIPQYIANELVLPDDVPKGVYFKFFGNEWNNQVQMRTRFRKLGSSYANISSSKTVFDVRFAYQRAVGEAYRDYMDKHLVDSWWDDAKKRWENEG